MELTNETATNQLTYFLETLLLELKIPLFSLSFNIQSLKRLNSSNENENNFYKKIIKIEESVNDLNDIFNCLNDLIKLQNNVFIFNKSNTHTYELLSDAVSNAQKFTKEELVEIEIKENEYCTIFVDKDKFVQLLSRMIRIFFTHSKHDCKVKLSTKKIGNSVQFILKKDTCLTNELINSAKSTLILALTKIISQAHNGNFYIESTKDQHGTIMTIVLPSVRINPT